MSFWPIIRRLARDQERQPNSGPKRIAVASKRTIPEVINTRAYFVSKKARDLTPVGSRDAIENALGVSGYALNYTKKGDRLKKHSKGAALFSGGNIYALVNYWRKKKGGGPVSRSEMAAAAQKFLTRRLRAVGSLKNGWSGAVGKLAAAAHQTFTREGPSVKMGGRATPAKPGWDAKVEFEYREAISSGQSGRHIDVRVVSALDRAFADEQKEMVPHLEEKMTKAMKEAGAM
jgi:hypothetical protein